ncbi:hypothetical protein BZM27_41870 [Paraburkholderia steynii]|uniref:Uncharacterized protein n=1 Tax=Paraburkholderia steynii TaxID=1245441 RepID=A0A4R0XBG8_9BURK|nr:hypothetical protein BZM27_41870 [Paraburkholderia steynii]
MLTDHHPDVQSKGAASRTHSGFSRTFQPGKLTPGFIAPLEGYPNSASPTLKDHEHRARAVDARNALAARQP